MKKHSLTLIFCVIFMALVACSGCSSSSGSGTKAGTTNLKTYIASTASGDLECELVSRFNNVVASYDASDLSSDVVNYVVAGSDLENDLNVLSQAMLHTLNSKNLIILSPTYEQVKKFYQLIDTTVDAYEKIKEETENYSTGSSSVEQFVNQFRIAETSQDLENILNAYGNRGDAPVLDILGFRGSHIYYANVNEPAVVETGQEQEEPDIPEASADASEDVESAETAETETESREALISDGCIDWINDYNSSSETTAALTAKGQALLSSNAADGAAVPTIAGAQKITHNLTANAAVAIDGLFKPATSLITILDYVWTCHSFTNGKDYILVEQHITYNNQDYGCNGSPDDDCWNSAYGWENMYGPYFKSTTITNKLCSGLLNYDYQSPVLVDVNDVTLYDANPKTTIGETSYSKGVSFNIGGDIGATTSGPTAGISAGFSWSESQARTQPDISTTRADEDGDTSPKWTFDGNTPKWYWKPLWIPNKHDQAANILRTQFETITNWVWEIENTTDKDHYQLWTRLYIQNEILTKDGINHWRWTQWHLCDALNVPCRYKTTLTSFLSCDNTEKRDALEKYLKQKITSYKDSYDIAVIKDPKENVYYLRQNAADTLGKIEAEIEKSKEEIQAAGFSDVGNCKISLKDLDLPKSDALLGSFTIDLSN